MKKVTLLVFAIIYSAAALAEFNPRKPAPQPEARPTLECVGLDAGYPRASISYDHHTDSYEVAVAYDLDVPGGASGLQVLTAKGSITEDRVDLRVSNRKLATGSWVGDAYDVWIDDAEFMCSLR